MSKEERILNRVCPYCHNTVINFSRLAYSMLMEENDGVPTSHKKIIIGCGYCNNTFPIQDSIPKPE